MIDIYTFNALTTFPVHFSAGLDLGFFPVREARNENQLSMEITITRESDRSLGSDLTLRLVFLPPPDPITDNDANPGKNPVLFIRKH